ncbi:MAG: SPOR domain-containing protein [Deltaproteobacteria bacterium]|nr:SPOR domain-containing protein [Deltaproteobacteria bacterium]
MEPRAGPFFYLAALILAGAVFAAGVMVGRQMAVEEDRVEDPLSHIDRRYEQDRASVDAGGLIFPETLASPGDGGMPEEVLDTQDQPGVDPPAITADAGRSGSHPEILPAVYCLQVASFREPEQAQALVKRLAAHHPHVRSVTGEVPGKGRYHRVRLGSFADLQTAEDYQKRLAADGLQSLVMRCE